MKNHIKIPLWITLFGGFLAVFGLGMGVMGYFQPDMVISGFTGDTNAHKMAMWMTSGRNIAMATVMIVALVSKKPELIGLAFIMRLVTEADATTAVGSVVATGFDDSSGLWYYEKNGEEYLYLLESQFGALFGINEFDPPFTIKIVKL